MCGGGTLCRVSWLVQFHDEDVGARVSCVVVAQRSSPVAGELIPRPSWLTLPMALFQNDVAIVRVWANRQTFLEPSTETQKTSPSPAFWGVAVELMSDVPQNGMPSPGRALFQLLCMSPVSVRVATTTGAAGLFPGRMPAPTDLWLLRELSKPLRFD